LSASGFEPQDGEAGRFNVRLPNPLATYSIRVAPFFPVHVFLVEPGARLLFLARTTDRDAGDGDGRQRFLFGMTTNRQGSVATAEGAGGELAERQDSRCPSTPDQHRSIFRL
jgi:hypothetical protein